MLIFIVVIFANLSLAMEQDNREHRPPTLSLDYQGNRAIFKIASPQEWRDGNSYLRNKLAIEQAIIAEPEAAIEYSVKRFSSIVLDPIFKKRFDIKDIKEMDEFFHPTQDKNIVGNHYTLIKECSESWCPLTRSLTNRKRTDFENTFVERIKKHHDIQTPIRYIGFGSGLSLFSDLRIILMLKKAGYKFEKIQIIDPAVEPYINCFIKLNTKNGAVSPELPRNGKTLKEYFSNITHFESILNTHLIAQFLGILSNYDGDEIVEYYLNIDDYIKDFTDSSKAHVIVTLDVLDPNSIANLKAIPIIQDFEKLKLYNNGALMGSFYADYLHQKPDSNFKFNTKRYSYAMNSDIMVINSPSIQCGVCPIRMAQMKKCPCGLAFYCSTVCQKKDWPIHKNNPFHQKK